jgi:SAM-dependent methyltransferase
VNVNRPDERPLSAETTKSDRLILLSVDLLRERPDLASRFQRLSRTTLVALGWHYLLDLIWIACELGSPAGKKVMDAGAGLGVLQWYLAEEGADVLSVDRSDRSRMPESLRARFRVAGFAPGDLAAPCSIWKHGRLIPREVVGRFVGLRTRPTEGRVTILRGDLGMLNGVTDRSLDAVVSVSALEHNDPERLPAVVDELLRVLRPGGRLLATLPAARDRDWYHVPSAGWCYSEGTLRQAFRLAPAAVSNWTEFDRVFEALCRSRELRSGLSWRYRLSGRNGMPWGRWDPRYHPVGIYKVKS